MRYAQNSTPILSYLRKQVSLHWSGSRFCEKGRLAKIASLMLAMILLLPLPVAAQESVKESAYDRVMKTQTIKCGYGIWSPWINRNPETDEMEGIVVDIMEEVAKKLELQTDWSYESGWSTLPTDLLNGKVDVACSTMWNDPKRGRSVAFTDPIFFIPAYAFTRADDTRFSGKLSELNTPGVKISIQDADFSDALASRIFPNAEKVAIPQVSQWSDTLTNVAAEKADFVIADIVVVQEFNETNDVKLKRIPTKEPITVYGNAFAVGIKESALKETLQTTVKNMIQTGEIESITAEFLKKHPEAIILPSKPYEVPAQ